MIQRLTKLLGRNFEAHVGLNGISVVMRSGLSDSKGEILTKRGEIGKSTKMFLAATQNYKGSAR